MARLWLLDFDGTLVDSEKAIKSCYLKVGKELVPERSNFIKTMVIGPTLDETSRMILTDEKIDLLDVFKNKFQKIYDEKLVLTTKKYTSVDSTLKQLNDKSDDLCIVTNKRSNPTLKLINYYGWIDLFYWIACIDEYPEANNKSDLIKLKKINKKKYDAIYLVGDTLSDGIAANDNRISFIRANYGYGTNQNWKKIKIYKTINQFNEILKIT